MDCNAIELCSLPTGNVCRLSKSISTNLVTGVGSCSRLELKHPCGSGLFYNRRTNQCQCVIDCDYNTMTPPIGGFLTTNVYLGVDMITTNCMNTAGHVWMMIQRRMDGSVNFYRGWAEYKTGFGDINTEFWIGLDNIRLLVMNGYTILRVELEDGSESAYAEYSSFYIADENDKYRIHVSGYSGIAGDGISSTSQYSNNNAQFSTFDSNNDASSTRVNAVRWRGAWWYHDGHTSNLNGEYGNNNHGEEVSWYYFKGWTHSLSGTRMMLRMP
uniref:Tenascin-R-like n=1 Tax=Crassostrea virginica TaxID=6565 RepID=A0A8B8AZ39_CRAVI|nr:tenascin-R-like [Crassostrea virginica]